MVRSLLPGPVVKRVLFVDDEQNVLDGLRNLLRNKRRDWDMSFACGGEAAFGLLKEMLFDVVVTDMRMPKIDGVAVLSRVMELQPRAVRIVLSGQTDPESVMKTVFLAHRYLAKPCEAEDFRTVVERAFQLRSLLESPELRAAVGEVPTLPPAPGTFIALTQAMSRPETSVKDIVRIVERDVGLCAKILQLVNSAFFGLPRKVASLFEAVSYLGTSTIKNVALAVEAFRVEPCPGAISPQDLQTHSLLTGQLARHFMGSDKLRGEDAFLAGVLHDLGRLIRLPDPGQTAIQHPILGAYLLSLWGIPQTIIEAVAHHEAPSQLEHGGFEVVDAVHVADVLAAEQSGHCDPSPLDLPYLADRGISEARLDEWRGMARKLASGRAEAAA